MNDLYSIGLYRSRLLWLQMQRFFEIQNAHLTI